MTGRVISGIGGRSRPDEGALLTRPAKGALWARPACSAPSDRGSRALAITTIIAPRPTWINFETCVITCSSSKHVAGLSAQHAMMMYCRDMIVDPPPASVKE
jgi:hypothetical protein